ncbi:pyridoxal phosphate-dependent aminotransferase [Bifidobacterium aquikefiri]|uniref:pyridoxal phosphate-dependent aminotransferase n=1 Tax=Bifidobacterium aquikefiri TaxID=1653207 RepID=UPI0039EC6BBA
MTAQAWQTLSNRIQQVAPSATLAVDTKAKAMKAEGIDIIGFGAGEPNFPTPEYIVDAAVAACQDPRNHRYTPTAGLPELRAAIARKTERDEGYAVDPAQVVVTNGGKQAVYETLQVLIDPGDEVIVPAPYWTSYPEMIKLAGGKPVSVLASVDHGFIPTVAQLDAARSERTKAIIVNSPSNPCGSVWDAKTIRDIAHWAIEHHIWILSDEIYEHLTYDNTVTSYIGAEVPECREQLIVLNGVAKTFAMTGWRVGWLIAPRFFAQAVSKLQGHLSSNVSDVSQRAALAAVSGDLSAVAHMRSAFDIRRQHIETMLNEIPDVFCPNPTGAFYAFCNVTGLLNNPHGPHSSVAHTSAELAALLLEEAHIAAVPGEAFGAEGYLRFSYALDDKDLIEGIRRFKAWVEA